MKKICVAKVTYIISHQQPAVIFRFLVTRPHIPPPPPASLPPNPSSPKKIRYLFVVIINVEGGKQWFRKRDREKTKEKKNKFDVHNDWIHLQSSLRIAIKKPR